MKYFSAHVRKTVGKTFGVSTAVSCINNLLTAYMYAKMFIKCPDSQNFKNAYANDF